MAGPYDLYDYAKGYFDATKDTFGKHRRWWGFDRPSCLPICFDFRPRRRALHQVRHHRPRESLKERLTDSKAQHTLT